MKSVALLIASAAVGSATSAVITYWLAILTLPLQPLFEGLAYALMGVPALLGAVIGLGLCLTHLLRS